MKLLIVFVAACAVLLALVGWQLAETWQVAAPTAAVPHSTQPWTGDMQIVATRAASSAEGASPVTDPPAPEITARSPVQWAEDPAVTAARRRLERASQALREDPYHPAALRDQAAALAGLRRWSEAADTLARLRRAETDDANLAFDEAAMLMRAQRWTDALAILTVFVEQRSDHAPAWFNLGVAHRAVGHLAAARDAWDRSIALAPTVEALARRGEVLLDLHDWGLAAADFEAVLARVPEAADATLNLAWALWKAGRAEEARTHLTAFLESHPRHVPTLNRLAEIAWGAYEAAPGENAARRLEAIGCWRQSLQLDPEQTDVQARFESATQSEREGQ